MRLLALELIFSLLDVRGHIPRFNDVRPAPAAPTPVGAARALAALIAVLVGLSLAIWAAARLAAHLF
ncbi:hypothetical protein JQ580_03265 [Bradyrhizobium japonicum]|uniref:hypothetical protein n=1 Tax=Bradyrhizobium japonicum TaxID=375 RepID=UPI001BAD840A|nr:hypothetical protein [Bradyrhizobium japonicum]MBR0989730.1 hypothetical protein [Bradyrhizobium japonicum]